MDFIRSCIAGEVLLEEIDDYVEDWHEGRAGLDQELHEFLGMNWEEYSMWVTNPSILPYIISARRRRVTLAEELEMDRVAMAARAGSAMEALRVEKWLRGLGKIQ